MHSKRRVFAFTGDNAVHNRDAHHVLCLGRKLHVGGSLRRDSLSDARAIAADSSAHAQRSRYISN